MSEIIEIRDIDGFVNGTKLCKGGGRKWHDYIRLEGTKNFLIALSNIKGVPTSQMIQSVTDGLNDDRCTWIEQDIAIHLSQWISPEFQVAVCGYIRKYSAAHPEIVIKDLSKCFKSNPISRIHLYTPN